MQSQASKLIQRLLHKGTLAFISVRRVPIRSGVIREKYLITLQKSSHNLVNWGGFSHWQLENPAVHKYQSRRDLYLLPSLLGLSGVTN